VRNLVLSGVRSFRISFASVLNFNSTVEGRLIACVMLARTNNSPTKRAFKFHSFAKD